MGSGVTRPVRKQPQATNHVPFNVVPGTVDTGNAPGNCSDCSQSGNQVQQFQQPPQYYMQTVSCTIPHARVVGNTIVQPAPITTNVIYPSAPPGEQVHMQPLAPPPYTHTAQDPPPYDAEAGPLPQKD